MIKVKTVHTMGGACPWQLEATTDDSRDVYVRYRFGWLSMRVGKTPGDDALDVDASDEVFQLKLDPDGWAGQLNGATLAAKTRGFIEWPAEVVADGEIFQ